MRKLKDLKARAKILFRVQKIENDGHFGDCKPVGDSIRELRVDYAIGYRVYLKEKRENNSLANWWREVNSTKRHSKRNLEKIKQIEK